MAKPLHEFPSNLDERRAELDAARARLLDAVERSRHEPGTEAGGQWSLAQLVYHLHLAESFTTRGLRKKLASSERVRPANVERLRQEWERIRTVVGTRHPKAQSPARVVPDGAPDLDQALTLLAESRRAFMQVLEEAPEQDLLSIILPHPFPAVGELIAVSWTTVTAFHELRHSEQVREMAAAE